MENLIKITVEDDVKGSRIDAALAGSVQNLSRSAIQKLIERQPERTGMHRKKTEGRCRRLHRSAGAGAKRT